MDALTKAGDPAVGLADLKLIDGACDRFEAAWREDERPDLAEFLAGAEGPARGRLFGELLAMEVEARLGRGESPDPADYARRFPEFVAAVDDAFAWIGASGETLRSPRGPGRSPGPVSPGPAGPGPPVPRARLSPAVRASLAAAGYDVLGELGRGGMGVVYLARKVALNRLCALKMILAGPHAGTSAASRFRAEAEAVARLRHPDIVQVYHVGEADGHAFLELEYLPGGSLEKALDGRPRPAAEAARLVEVLAVAIAEAHRQGVVHRDLKPANVLMELNGRPKVADFGLAKFLDSDDGLTKTRAVLGSPSYMAPEQAEGHARDVGAPADVYALGAILYELLTGRPPFRAATALETLAQVKSTDPLPPSRIQPGLPRDLETVCLKCLNKAPARRYATADDLAEDLRRFLAGEPVRARPAPPWERAWKWSRRHPALAAALGVTAAAVVAMLAGAAYYSARLRDEAGKAKAARVVAIRERDTALKIVRGLVYDLQEQLIEAPATRSIRGALLDKAIAGLDEIASGGEGSAPDLSRAVAHLKLGDIHSQLGHADEATEQFQRARGLAEVLVAAAPDDRGARECLRDAYIGLGELRLKDDRADEAEPLFRQAVAESEALAGERSQAPSARGGRILAYRGLGKSTDRRDEKSRPAAETCYRTMRELADLWLRDDPASAEAKVHLADSHVRFARLRKDARELKAAVGHDEEAVRIGREVLRAAPRDLRAKALLATALLDLGILQLDLRDDRAARPWLEEAIRLHAEWTGADPEDVEAQVRHMFALYNLGRVERDDGNFAKAERVFREALDRLQALDREGRLDHWPTYKTNYPFILRREIRLCQAAPRVGDDLAAARDQPAYIAARLLLLRAGQLAREGRWPEVPGTIEALLAVKPGDWEEWLWLARALAACHGLLDPDRAEGASETPGLPALRDRCAEEAVAALRRAVGLGYRDLPWMENEIHFASIRQHPGFRELIDGLRNEDPRTTGGARAGGPQ